MQPTAEWPIVVVVDASTIAKEAVKGSFTLAFVLALALAAFASALLLVGGLAQIVLRIGCCRMQVTMIGHHQAFAPAANRNILTGIGANELIRP